MGHFLLIFQQSVCKQTELCFLIQIFQIIDSCYLTSGCESFSRQQLILSFAGNFSQLIDRPAGREWKEGRAVVGWLHYESQTETWTTLVLNQRSHSHNIANFLEGHSRMCTFCLFSPTSNYIPINNECDIFNLELLCLQVLRKTLKD